MTKFTKFEKSNLALFRNELQALLDKHGIESNITFEAGKIRWEPGSLEISVKAKINGAVTLDDSILNSVMISKGLKKEGIGGRILVEYNSRRYKRPYGFILNGQRYICDEQTAKVYFKA